jgi:hypothetical protein
MPNLRRPGLAAIYALLLAGCGPLSREPAPRLRGAPCARECEQERDTCYRICTDDPDADRCEERCGQQLSLCKQLCE